MLVIAIFRLATLGFSYYTLTRLSNQYGGSSYRYNFLSFALIFWTVLPVAEVIIYWLIRYRIQKRAWVHLHVWTSFVVFVILPLSVLILVRWSFNFMRGNDYVTFMETFNRVVRYLTLGLLAIGHVFFIATIVKSYRRQKVTENNEVPAGLLDEFVS
ncbi:MAG: hypothetical protein ABW019_00825 [Chitinophagaceae bacterium]